VRPLSAQSLLRRRQKPSALLLQGVGHMVVIFGKDIQLADRFYVLPAVATTRNSSA
jgi:hypothetical protein